MPTHVIMHPRPTRPIPIFQPGKLIFLRLSGPAGGLSIRGFALWGAISQQSPFSKREVIVASELGLHNLSQTHVRLERLLQQHNTQTTLHGTSINILLANVYRTSACVLVCVSSSECEFGALTWLGRALTEPRLRMRMSGRRMRVLFVGTNFALVRSQLLAPSRLVFQLEISRVCLS